MKAEVPPIDVEKYMREYVLYETLKFPLRDGSEVALPYRYIVGRRREPTVAVVAGVHGDELVGPRAGGELAEELAPTELRGAVLLIPCANPHAFAAGRRAAPEDDLDLNRIFPGLSRGAVTRRIAFALAEMIDNVADLVIDLHSAGREGDLLPLSGFREARNDCARSSALAAAAFGLEHYWMMRWAPGTLSTWANQRGIPAVGCEVGGRGRATREQIDLYKAGTRRCLRHLGLLDPPLDVAMPPKVWTQEHLTAPGSGLLETLVTLGQDVRAGETLARVRDLWGVVCAEITAPRDGRILYTRVQQSVGAGENVFWLGRQEDNPCYSPA